MDGKLASLKEELGKAKEEKKDKKVGRSALAVYVSVCLPASFALAGWLPACVFCRVCLSLCLSSVCFVCLCLI